MLKLRSENVLTPDNLEEYINSISCFDNKAIFTNPDELPQRIVAIGDIHGDLEALFSILLRAEVIDITGKWIAINTFLVQTGDIFDKGRRLRMLERVGVNHLQHVGEKFIPYDVIESDGTILTINSPHIRNNLPFGEAGDEIIILKFLADLNAQAQNESFGNSRILLCCGNHEVSNVMEYLEDNYNHAIEHGYIHPMDNTLFGGPDYPIRQKIMTIGSGILARKLACILKVVVVIGDFIFCHGGLSISALWDINSIVELDIINDMFRKYLLADPRVDLPRLRRYIGNTMGESITWYRDQGEHEIPPMVCSDTLITLFRNKFKNPNLNLVIGHSIQGICIDPKFRANPNIPRTRFIWDRTNPDRTVDTCITLPTAICNNQIYRIDTAISRMNGTPNYQYPAEGRLNSLIINLNPDGSKHSVIARNNILHDVQI
jgi:hypothetical protein